MEHQPPRRFANNSATSLNRRARAIANAVADAAFNRYPDPAVPALKAKPAREAGHRLPWHGVLLRSGPDEVIAMDSAGGAALAV